MTLPLRVAPVLFSLIACGALAFGGCGASPRLTPQAFSEQPLQFGACPDEVTREGLEVECALLEVPLNWQSPERSESIVIFVRRLPAPRHDERAHQLWVLDGGPGFAGDGFTDPAFYGPIHAAGYDIYIPSHRGTAYGTALSCPGMNPGSDSGVLVSPGEAPACLAHLQARFGDDWKRFGSNDAALDVRHLLRRVPLDGRRVAFGGSYGSYWGQRLLQRAPGAFDGMWLDSIVDLQSSLERADANADRAGRALIEACAADEACAAHFVVSPEATAEQVLRRFRAGKGCSAEIRSSLSRLQRLLFRLLSGSPSEQALVAPVLLRAERCSEADARALDQAFTVLDQVTTPQPSLLAYNPLLNRHVIFAELYRFDRSPQDISRESRAWLFSAGADAPLAAQAQAYGASFRAPPAVNTPATDTHLVLVQGGLDPLDPPEWARRTRDRWADGPVTLLEVPHSGHSVVRYAITDDGEACTVHMFTRFLRAPRAPVERGCLDQLRPLDLAATHTSTREAAQRWLGTPRAWAN